MIVVGAGPVGLTAALALRSRGIDTTVLEAEPEDRVRPGSRAIYVHRASLLLLDGMRAGLGESIGRRGIVWSRKRTCWRGRDVFVRSYRAPDPATLPPFASLSQEAIEAALLDACLDSGVDVRWGTAVRTAASQAGGVRLTDAAGIEWQAQYVIAADGARSTVRHQIGVAMHGSRSETTYVVVDVDEDGGDPLPVERVFHYEHPAAGGRNVLLVPFAGGWRADLQCRRDDDPAAFSGDQAAGWIAAVLGPRYARRLRWVSTYRFLRVVAAAMTDPAHRVLLAGEAAHLFPPFGARGLNSGVADAAAAARAVAQALRSPAEAHAAVAAFAADRSDAAQRNSVAAGRALAATESAHPWHVARRRLAGALAPRLQRAAAWLDSAPYGPRLRDAPRGADGY